MCIVVLASRCPMCVLIKVQYCCCVFPQNFTYSVCASRRMHSDSGTSPRPLDVFLERCTEIEKGLCFKVEKLHRAPLTYLVRPTVLPFTCPGFFFLYHIDLKQTSDCSEIFSSTKQKMSHHSGFSSEDFCVKCEPDVMLI